MAITHIDTNEGTPTSGLTNKSTVTKPTGLAVGDVMVAYTVSNQAGITAPSNRWTRILQENSNQGNLFRVEVWYCVATSSETAASSFIWTDGDSSSPMWAAISAYRGVNTTTPIDAFDSTPDGSGASKTTPSITTTNSAMILHHRAVRKTSGTTAFTSGVTNERFEGSNASTVGYSAAMYDAGSETAAGSISGVSITASSSSGISDSIATTVALRTLVVAVSANAGKASAEITATPVAANLTESPDAGVGAATAVGKAPTVGVGAPAGKASASATVQQVTVSSTPFKNAPAGCAQVTAVGQQTRMNYAPAGRATASVSLINPSESVGNRADTALVMATGLNPSVGFTVNAGVAQVAGVGKLAGPGLGAVIGVAGSSVVVYGCVLYFGSTRTIKVTPEDRLITVPWEERTLMVEES